MQVDIINYSPVPVGTYLLKVTDCQLRQNSKDNSNFLGWNSAIESPGSDLHGRNISIATSLKFGPKSFGYKFLKALGLQHEEGELKVNTDDFIGCYFYAKVGLKPDNTDNKIEDVWSVAEFQKMVSMAAPPQSAAQSAPRVQRIVPPVQRIVPPVQPPGTQAPAYSSQASRSPLPPVPSPVSTRQASAISQPSVPQALPTADLDLDFPAN